MNLIKFGSRKFIISIIQVAITVGLPFIYKKYSINDDILLSVLWCINGAGFAYTGANLMDKHLGNKNEQPS